MALQQLSLISDAPAAAQFDGNTFNAKQDGQRLTSQLDAVREILLDHRWRNIPQLALMLRKRGIACTEASISARIRDLRKEKFGAYRVESRRVIRGLWEFRIA